MAPSNFNLSDTADRLAEVSGLETILGKPSSVIQHRKIQRDLASVGAAVGALEARLDRAAPAPTDEPLFIFSAGWRSGSTLLQRLVVSANTHFVWGEPYNRSDSVRRLAESLIPFATGWPEEDHLYARGSVNGKPVDDQLSSHWIANLYPPVNSLIDAHRAFLLRLLAPPAEHADLGWGLKEVRLSADYASYLRMLFPRARFVFIVRDPHTAYRSYREHPTWFDRWPRSQVRTPYAFGMLWRRLAGSFLAYEQALGATLLRFEDIVARGVALDRLDQAIGAPVDRSVLGKRIRASSENGHAPPSALELRMLDRATRPVATRLGYGAGRS